MTEAEVALNLAFHLLALPKSAREIDVSLDGAQVSVGGAEVFPLVTFLAHHGWKQVTQSGKNPWQGAYVRGEHGLRINCRSGVGDVVCVVGSHRVRAECKKGPLVATKGNPEYPRLREALGQVLTVEAVDEHDMLVVAVPHSAKFKQLAELWSVRPMMRRVGIRIALVARGGTVTGLEDLSSL